MRRKITDHLHCLLPRLLICGMSLLIAARVSAASGCDVEKMQPSLVYDVCNNGIQFVSPSVWQWGDWSVGLQMCYQYQKRKGGREIKGLWMRQDKLKQTLQKIVLMSNDSVRNDVAKDKCQKNDIDCMGNLFHQRMVENFRDMPVPKQTQCIVSYHIDSEKLR